MAARYELKQRAKDALKNGHYWPAVGMTFAILIIVGAIASILALVFGGTDTAEQTLAQSISSSIASTLFSIFVATPIGVGFIKYFINLSYASEKFGDVLSSFGENYLNIVWTMFKRGVLIFLWTLLLIVPGIIKTYQYAMTDFILAEDPSIDSREALIKSRDMMQGHKWEYFVLQLSFIGWFFLGLLALGIGMYFVVPYYNETCVQFYNELKREQY